MSALHEVKAWIADELPRLIEKHDVPAAAVAVLAGGEVIGLEKLAQAARLHPHDRIGPWIERNTALEHIDTDGIPLEGGEVVDDAAGVLSKPPAWEQRPTLSSRSGPSPSSGRARS